MINFLEKIDLQLLLLINGAHSPLFDSLMWWLSLSTIWIPLYCFLLFILFKKYQNQFWKIIVIIIISVTLTDGISSGIIKPSVKRYRPSHNLEIKEKLYLHQYSNGTFYKGGTYGFVSSHAANSFGIATLIILLLGRFSKQYYWLILWAIAISYSRIYLGVHYPSDIVGGFLVGISSTFIAFYFAKKLLKFNVNLDTYKR